MFLEFPYQFSRTYRNWYPIIPVRIKSSIGTVLESAAYLDTGAAFSIFQASEADLLGLDLGSGKVRSATAGDGRILRCHILPVTIEVGPYQIKAEVGFSRGLHVGLNILGLDGFFSHFREVAFRHIERRVILYK